MHEGDTTTITLPVGVVPASPNAFEIKDGSNVIATGRVVDGKPGKVILTYTSYVEGKSDIRGKFFFNVQIDNSVYTSAQQIPVNLTVNGETVPAGAVNYKLGEASLQPVIKSGWMWSQDSTVGIYQIKINQENKELINAKITDTLLNRMQLVELFDNLFDLFENDPEFKSFHLDGQTIVLAVDRKSVV